MAGDWIKMRTDLSDDPAVVAMAVRLEIDEDHVVGKLHRIWAWADRHTIDGATSGVNEAWVDKFVAKRGFAAAMQSVGWLVIAEDGIRFPGFEKHNGESAKKRADAQQRQRASRASRHDSVTSLSRDVVPKPFRKAVYIRDQYTCVYCGTESDETRESMVRKRRLSVDHITPMSQGGKTVIENLVTCCRECNSEKSDRTPEEWGLLPTHLANGVSYQDGHICVTNECDKSATREEKRREEEHSLSENVLVKPKRKAFVPPTVEEVRAFCAERGNSVDAEQFVAHYESQGWKKSNGQRVINWQACVVSTWEKNNGRSSGGASGGLFTATGNGQGRGFQSRNEQRIASSAAALLEFATDDDDEAGVRQVDGRIGPPQANDGVHQARIAGVVRGPALLSVDGGQPGGDRDEPF